MDPRPPLAPQVPVGLTRGSVRSCSTLPYLTLDLDRRLSPETWKAWPARVQLCNPQVFQSSRRVIEFGLASAGNMQRHAGSQLNVARRYDLLPLWAQEWAPPSRMMGAGKDASGGLKLQKQYCLVSTSTTACARLHRGTWSALAQHGPGPAEDHRKFGRRQVWEHT